MINRAFLGAAGFTIAAMLFVMQATGTLAAAYETPPTGFETTHPIYTFPTTGYETVSPIYTFPAPGPVSGSIVV